MTQAQPWDWQAVHDELDRVQADFRRLLGQATPSGLARRTNGTKWTNEQLLFHATRPFDLINYLGPCIAIHIYGHDWMAAKLDRVLAALRRRLDTASTAGLKRGMHYPARWDPFFTGYMTLADLYRYPTQHYDFHRRQLTLTPA